MDFASKYMFTILAIDANDQIDKVDQRQKFLTIADNNLKNQLLSAFIEVPKFQPIISEKIEPLERKEEYSDYENTASDIRILPFEEFIDISQNIKNIKNKSIEETINKIHMQLMNECGIIKMQRALSLLWVNSIAQIYEIALSKYTEEEKQKVIKHLNFRLDHFAWLLTNEYELDNNQVLDTIAEIKYCIKWDFFKTSEYASQNIKDLITINPLEYINYYLDKIRIEYPWYYKKINSIYWSDYNSLINSSLEHYKKNYYDIYPKLSKIIAVDIGYLYDYIVRHRQKNIDYTLKQLDNIINWELISK